MARYGAVLAAAGAVVLAVVVARLRSDATPMTVAQRAFAASLDEGDVDADDAAAPDPAEPPNLELTVTGAGLDAARLLVTDASGALLRPVAPFEVSKDGSGALRAYVTPRALPPHDGDAIAWVVAGTMPAVTKVFEELPYPLTTLGAHAEASDSSLNDAIRRSGAQLRRIVVTRARPPADGGAR